MARRLAFWRSGGAPENVSKNPKFEGSRKKRESFSKTRFEVGVARELRDGVSEIDHPTESSNPKYIVFDES